jgi:hypothetical protein
MLTPKKGLYDVCVTSGAFGEGHIPHEGVREVARVVKQGGYIIIVMRKEYLTTVAEYTDRLEPLMQEMSDQEHVWTQIARIEVPNYSFDKTGVVFIFQKN